jgi:Reverse transcriptase (RNA-dependent DNA polymerase)
METLFKESIVHHLEENKLFSNKQHGFTRGRSCLTNLLEKFEEFIKAVDEGYGTDMIYLDFHKAFDTVSHKGLLNKVRQSGITGNLLKWIEDFPVNRRTRVRVNAHDAFFLLKKLF